MKVTAFAPHVDRLLRCGLVLSFCLASAPAMAMPDTGDKAPEFVGRNYDGQPIAISAYAGKVVVVSFWALWCPPCRKELPLLEGIQQTAGKQRLQVIAVNIESLDTFQRIARKMTSLHILIGSDSGGEARRAYGVNGIPHMVIIGKSGEIVRVNRGYSEEGVDKVIRDLNQALAQ